MWIKRNETQILSSSPHRANVDPELNDTLQPLQPDEEIIEVENEEAGKPEAQATKEQRKETYDALLLDGIEITHTLQGVPWTGKIKATDYDVNWIANWAVMNSEAIATGMATDATLTKFHAADGVWYECTIAEARVIRVMYGMGRQALDEEYTDIL